MDFALSAATVLAVSLPGAPPSKLTRAQYGTQDWQVEDVLLQGNVRSIAQLPGNLMLMATVNGVATFEGRQRSSSVTGAAMKADSLAGGGVESGAPTS